MSSTSSNYKQTLKATSLFGGIQIFTIIVNVIRSKFIAILLGPEGMGISGLLTSTTGLITSLTNCGLSSSAVRNIAVANATNNIEQISKTIKIFRRFVLVTGCIGLLTCLLLSPYLSLLTFGNKDYTQAFILLSVTLLFTQITSGQTTLLQGLQKYGYMAKATLIGNIIGLFITIPLYYWKGINAIVPVIIIASLTSLIISSLFSRKIKLKNVQLKYSDYRTEGGNMLKMGLLLSIKGIFSILAAYILKIFISQYGNISDVGLYNAGFVIIDTYVGLVFNAMATDYYPRLSRTPNNQFNSLINQQVEISILLLAPIITCFIIFIHEVIIILYSNRFIPIEIMLYWAIYAIFFKAPSWCIAYSFLAKGDTKTFFWNEIPSSIYSLIFNILGYYWGGLTGLGISYCAIYIVYLLQVYIVAQKKYQFRLTKTINKLFLIQICLASICIILISINKEWIKFTLGLPVIFISTYVSYIYLNKRIDIKSTILHKIRKTS